MEMNRTDQKLATGENEDHDDGDNDDELVKLEDLNKGLP